MMYLAQGLVFRTPAGAKKTARRFLIEGRTLSNLSKKRDFLRARNDMLLDCALPDDGFDGLVNDIFIPDLGDDAEPDAMDFPAVENISDREPDVAPDDRELLATVAVEDDEEAPVAEAAVAEPDPVPFELPEEVIRYGLALKKGERCYMDPVTGNFDMVDDEDDC